MLENLCKRKIIRDFLSLFTENYWKQLVATMLEYGIIMFNKHHKVASLTPEDIISLIEKLKLDENVNEKKRTSSRGKMRNTVDLENDASANKVKAINEVRGIRSTSKRADSRTNSTSSKKNKKFNFHANGKLKNSNISNTNLTPNRNIKKIDDISSLENNRSQYKNRDLSQDKSLKLSTNSNVYDKSLINNNLSSNKNNKNTKNLKKLNSKITSRESSLSYPKGNKNMRNKSNIKYNNNQDFINQIKIKQDDNNNFKKDKLNFNKEEEEEELNNFIRGNKTKLNKLIRDNSSDDASGDASENTNTNFLTNQPEKKLELKGISKYFKTHLSSSSNSDKEDVNHNMQNYEANKENAQYQMIGQNKCENLKTEYDKSDHNSQHSQSKSRSKDRPIAHIKNNKFKNDFSSPKNANIQVNNAKSKLKIYDKKNKKEKRLVDVNNNINCNLAKTPSSGKVLNLHNKNNSFSGNLLNIVNKKNPRKNKSSTKLSGKSKDSKIKSSNTNNNPINNYTLETSGNINNLTNLNSEEEFLRAKANNLKLIKKKTDNRNNIDTSPNSGFLLLEQRNINKLREKKMKQIMENQNKSLKMDDLETSNFNKKKIKVESKIKSQIEMDKKKFTDKKILKNANNDFNNLDINNDNINSVYNNNLQENIYFNNNIANNNCNVKDNINPINNSNSNSNENSSNNNYLIKNSEQNPQSHYNNADITCGSQHDKLSEFAAPNEKEKLNFLADKQKDNSFAYGSVNNSLHNNKNISDYLSTKKTENQFNNKEDVFLKDKMSILGINNVIENNSNNNNVRYNNTSHNMENRNSYQFPSLSNLNSFSNKNANNKEIKDFHTLNNIANSYQDNFNNIMKDLNYKNYNINTNQLKNFNEDLFNRATNTNMSKTNEENDQNASMNKNIIQNRNNNNNASINNMSDMGTKENFHSENYTSQEDLSDNTNNNNQNKEKINNIKNNKNLKDKNILNNNSSNNTSPNNLSNSNYHQGPRFIGDDYTSNKNAIKNSLNNNETNQIRTKVYSRLNNNSDNCNTNTIGKLNSCLTNNTNNNSFAKHEIETNNNFDDKNEIINRDTCNTDRPSLNKQTDLNIKNIYINSEYSSQTLNYEDKINGLKQKISNFENKFHIIPQMNNSYINSNLSNSILKNNININSNQENCSSIDNKNKFYNSNNFNNQSTTANTNNQINNINNSKRSSVEKDLGSDDQNNNCYDYLQNQQNQLQDNQDMNDEFLNFEKFKKDYRLHFDDDEE